MTDATIEMIEYLETSENSGEEIIDLDVNQTREGWKDWREANSDTVLHLRLVDAQPT